MRSALLAAIAAISAPAWAAPAKTHGDITVVIDVPAWGVAAAAGKLVVIDPTPATTSAYDATTGTRAWQASVAQDRGRHTLAVAGTSLLEWVADQLHVLAPTTGRELAAAAMPYNGDGCGLDIASGMCALRCSCSYQVVDCATGARIGKAYERTYTEMFPRHGPPSAGCWGGGSSTIGVVDGLALFSVEDAPVARDVTAAIVLATGKERWRTTFASSSLPGQSGHSPDGKTCWFGGRNGELRVLDCATGKQLWSSPAANGDDTVYAIAGFVAPHGLFTLAGARATLSDERTGKPRWRTTFAAPTMAWVRGTDQPLDWGNDDATAIALLDPTTGKAVATIAIPKAATVTPDGHGGAYVAGDRLAHYSGDGKLLGEAAIAKPRVVLGTDYLAAVTESSVAFLARADLHEIGHLDGRFQDVVVEGPLGPRRASLFEYDGKAPGRARVLRLEH